MQFWYPEMVNKAVTFFAEIARFPSLRYRRLHVRPSHHNP